MNAGCLGGVGVLNAQVCASGQPLRSRNGGFDVIGVGLNQETALVAVVQNEIVVLSLSVLIGQGGTAGAVSRELIRAYSRKGHDCPIDAFRRVARQAPIPIGCDLSDVGSRHSRAVETGGVASVNALESGSVAHRSRHASCHYSDEPQDCN